MFQIVSFLALLFYFLGYYLSQTLFDLLPRASGESAVLLLSMFNVVGYALSVVLCPVLLQLPRGNGEKSLAVGVGFILLVTVPQFVVRSLGAAFWFGTLAATVVLAISSGILFTLTHGLFFLSWNGRYTGKNQRSYLALFLAFAICVSILARLSSVPLLEISSVASDPLRAIAVMVNVIKWFMTGAGFLCAVCFILLKTGKPIERSHTVLHEAPERIAKTDWVMIARLVGLSVLFSLINAVMETGLYPFMGGIEAKRYTPHTMTVVSAICLCAFLAGRYLINRFLQWFLPPAIILFIFLPCLVLFDGYPGFVLLISTLVSIFRFSLWIIFTVAIVECYAPYGKGFWFFGLTSLVHYTGALSFLGPAINRAVPSGVEFTVLLMCISAALFVFLSLRIIFPKTPPVTAAETQPSAAKTPSITSFKNFEDTFRERGLSRREIEVAALLIQEGLGANEIGNRLFISERTVNDHIASIYRKFGVRKRGEFMTMFVGK